MTDFILSAGGEVKTLTCIEGIVPAKREIFTADGETYQYGKLVWAADHKKLYSGIRGQQTHQITKQRTLVEQNQGGDSILTLFIGVKLDKDYFSKICGAHAFYTPTIEGLSSLPSWKEAADDGKDAVLKWVSDYLARTTYEISCPALRDDSLAPEGKTGVIISALMDYQLVRRIADEGNYEFFKQFCTDTILQTLEASLFPNIRENIDFTLCSTPMTIERETGNAQGAITGWAFTKETMPAEKRLKKIIKSVQTPINDIFQCGQWTFSPSGLPVSVLTGKLAADEVRKKLKGNGS